MFSRMKLLDVYHALYVKVNQVKINTRNKKGRRDGDDDDDNDGKRK